MDQEIRVGNKPVRDQLGVDNEGKNKGDTGVIISIMV